LVISFSSNLFLLHSTKILLHDGFGKENKSLGYRLLEMHWSILCDQNQTGESGVRNECELDNLDLDNVAI
jgi:hypothetical protein